MAKRESQMELGWAPHPTWGGARSGAGRKPKPDRRPGVAHARRPAHAATKPALVTLRARPQLRCLRSERVFPALLTGLRAASRASFRVVHFSMQADHVHLLVEADGSPALARGMQGLAVRLARRVNRTLGLHGRVWDDRYHARSLGTPREVRSAIVYVLANWRKHGRDASRAWSEAPDPCSSGQWFDGWGDGSMAMVKALPAPAAVPVAPPATWLLRSGWRRHGAVRLDEAPARGAKDVRSSRSR